MTNDDDDDDDDDDGAYALELGNVKRQDVLQIVEDIDRLIANLCQLAVIEALLIAVGVLACWRVSVSE